MSVSLIIPAYNEEKRLPAFLESIQKYHAANPTHLHEVIVVDDGSSDNTAQVATGYSPLPNFQLIAQKPNQGKGAAIQAGVFKASGDNVVFMDADGATDIQELPKMIAALQDYEVGIGNRWMEGAVTHRHSWLRQVSGWVNHIYMSFFSLGNIDTMCGFKGYRRHIAQDLYTDLMEHRWLFDTEVAYKAIKRGYSIKNFPITWESKDGSKLDTKTLITSGLQILPLIQRINKAEKKRIAK